MPLAIGTRLGPYEITGTLGAGGMGEVYRARDAKLGRDVALKILPDAFAADPERLARFRREAQVLASLNHPHIGAIYGFEDSGDVHALVLELVEGDTLADRIARGPLPVDEALPIARQIAEALEAAHEPGIIHRDLKPANIKVTPDGVVKVLDFGLAKLTGPAESGPHGRSDFSQSPTITSPAMMTGIGTLLGTAAYMSPEQAKGRPADKRSDVWAFGCVLYEMLTARRAFDGEDMTEVLAAVVRAEPDWAALPADVPVPIQTVLTSCLVKSRGGRVAEMSTVLFVLDKAASLVTPVDPVSGAASLRASWRRRAITLVGAALGVAATVGTGVWFATRPAEPMPPRVSRLLIAAAGSEALSVTGDELAITPDGAHVVYVGNRGTQLFVRALDALEPVAVFTGEPRAPFMSPDGRWIGFRDAGGLMRKVPLSGGPAVTITRVDSFVRGALWATDDTIIVATNSAETGLRRITTSTGTATALTRPDRVQGEADHLWPEPLPGGGAVLFTITAVTGGLDAAQVAVLDLQTGKHTVLFRGGSHARFVPSGMKSATRGPGREDGHLVYAAGGALWAVPFDPVQLQTHGTPVPVVPQVVTTPLGGADAVIAANGTLAYVSGGVTASTPHALVWVDRQGLETPIPAPPRVYVYPRLSPDGTQVAVFTADQAFDVWMWDLLRATLRRVTFDPGVDGTPAWTPDGRLIFSSESSGVRNLFSQAADGTGAVSRLSESANRQAATAVSPDGRVVIFTETAPTTVEDVMAMTLDGTRRVTPLVQSRFIERNGIVSPDGRWLAYEANDSGRFEIFVRPFPDVNTGRWQVSTAGGTRPLWSRNQEELVYVSPDGTLMGVSVGRGPSWAASAPVVMVKAGYYTNPADIGRTYDIAPDAQRFLLIKEEPPSDETDPSAGIVVVQNWFEELKRLVPTN